MGLAQGVVGRGTAPLVLGACPDLSQVMHLLRMVLLLCGQSLLFLLDLGQTAPPSGLADRKAEITRSRLAVSPHQRAQPEMTLRRDPGHRVSWIFVAAGDAPNNLRHHGGGHRARCHLGRRDANPVGQRLPGGQQR